MPEIKGFVSYREISVRLWTSKAVPMFGSSICGGKRKCKDFPPQI